MSDSTLINFAGKYHAKGCLSKIGAFVRQPHIVAGFLAVGAALVGGRAEFIDNIIMTTALMEVGAEADNCMTRRHMGRDSIIETVPEEGLVNSEKDKIFFRNKRKINGVCASFFIVSSVLAVCVSSLSAWGPFLPPTVGFLYQSYIAHKIVKDKFIITERRPVPRKQEATKPMPI